MNAERSSFPQIFNEKLIYFSQKHTAANVLILRDGVL